MRDRRWRGERGRPTFRQSEKDGEYGGGRRGAEAGEGRGGGQRAEAGEYGCEARDKGGTRGERKGGELAEDASSSDGSVECVIVCKADESKLLIRSCVTNSSQKKTKNVTFLHWSRESQKRHKSRVTRDVFVTFWMSQCHKNGHKKVTKNVLPPLKVSDHQNFTNFFLTLNDYFYGVWTNFTKKCHVLATSAGSLEI